MSNSNVLYVRSKKKRKPKVENTSTSDVDVWDDTLLIQAYDKAINLVHSEVLKNMQDSSSKRNDNSSKNLKKHDWKKGDHCRCQYTADNIFYEAEIIDILDDIGLCIVRYVGYENEEKIPLHKLEPSRGEPFRYIQTQEALKEKLQNVKDDESLAKESVSGRNSRSRKKKSSGKKGEKTKFGNGSSFSENNFNFNANINSPLANMTIPPPPPPHMFANLTDDAIESEAMSAMLMAWYMSGYHTGYYQGLKTAKKR